MRPLGRRAPRRAAPRVAAARALHARRPRRRAAGEPRAGAATTRSSPAARSCCSTARRCSARCCAGCAAASIRVQREIDLHGLTVAEAKLRPAAVSRSSALEQQVRCVRIDPRQGVALRSSRPGAQDARSARCCAAPARCSPTSPRGRWTAAPARCTCCSSPSISASAARLVRRAPRPARAAPRWQSSRASGGSAAPRDSAAGSQLQLAHREAQAAPLLAHAGVRAQGALGRRTARRCATRARAPRRAEAGSPPPTTDRSDESPGAAQRAASARSSAASTAKMLPRPSRLARSPGSNVPQLLRRHALGQHGVEHHAARGGEHEAALGRGAAGGRPPARRTRFAPSRPKRCGPK